MIDSKETKLSPGKLKNTNFYVDSDLQVLTKQKSPTRITLDSDLNT